MTFVYWQNPNLASQQEVTEHSSESYHLFESVLNAPQEGVVGDQPVLEFDPNDSQDIQWAFTPYEKSGTFPLILDISYKMDQADPGEVKLRVRTWVDDQPAVVVSPAITPGSTTDWLQHTLTLLSSGNYEGDSRITVRFERIGGDPNDTHPGKLQFHSTRIRHS